MSVAEIENLLSEVEIIQQRALMNTKREEEVPPTKIINPVVVRAQTKNQSVYTYFDIYRPCEFFLYPEYRQTGETGVYTEFGNSYTANAAYYTDLNWYNQEQQAFGIQAYVDMVFVEVQTEPSRSELKLQQAKVLNDQLIEYLEKLEEENEEQRAQCDSIAERFRTMYDKQLREAALEKEQMTVQIEQLTSQVSYLQIQLADGQDTRAKFSKMIEQDQEFEALLYESNKQLTEAQQLLQFQASKISTLEDDKNALLLLIQRQSDCCDNFAYTDDTEPKLYQIAVYTDERTLTSEFSVYAEPSWKNKKVYVDTAGDEVDKLSYQTQTAFVCFQCNELYGVIQNYKEQTYRLEEQVESCQSQIEDIYGLVSQLYEENGYLNRRIRQADEENAAQAGQLDEFMVVMGQVQRQLKELKCEIVARDERIHDLDAQNQSLAQQNEYLVQKLERARAAFQ